MDKEILEEIKKRMLEIKPDKPMTQQEIEESQIMIKEFEKIKLYITENIRDIIFDNFEHFLDSIDEYEYEDILFIKKELDNWIKKIEILKLTPKKCPKCGLGEVLEIVYGLPSEDAYSQRHLKDLYFAGCEVDDYEWICKKCHWEWGKKVEGRYSENDFDD